MDPLLESLEPVVRRLAPPGSKVLVACSGGPDSQALLHVLCALRQRCAIEVRAAGVDHGLRPEASAELDLAAELAAEAGLELVRLRVEVVPGGAGLMAAAREARYGALRAEAARVGADRLAVGHTATDQAETLLFRMSRGTSLRGAAAMRPARGLLIRPLLGVTRAELHDYVKRHRLSAAADPSNLDTRWARPRVRHEVLPVLRQLHADADRRLARFAAEAAEDDDLLANLAERAARRCRGPLGSLDAAELSALPRPLARRVVARWLADAGLRASGRRIERLLAGATARRLGITLEGRRIRCEHGHLWAEPPGAAAAAELPAAGVVRWPTLGLELRSHPGHGAENPADNRPAGVAFDRGGLHLGLWARPWRPGDRIQPFGLQGHVKVGDLFTNYKIPTVLRPHWPVVLHGEDVVWVVGLRRSAHAPVTPATDHITRLTVALAGDGRARVEVPAEGNGTHLVFEAP